MSTEPLGHQEADYTAFPNHVLIQETPALWENDPEEVLTASPGEVKITAHQSGHTVVLLCSLCPSSQHSSL